MLRLRKIASILLIVFLTIGILPEKMVQASIDNINIISSTKITVEEAKQWAKDRNATNTFINLADLYWKYSSICGNVNPAIAYVQAALETGYGKFGGLLDESYHNPCGMKVTVSNGDSDQDANQHYRFNNWDEGVQAHLDHLALYAGANGYPKTNTFDPRHFPYIKGNAPTVKDLEGRWATSTGYAEKLLSLYNSMQDYHKLEPLGCIDSPSVNAKISTNTLKVSGWSLNESGISKINVYLDNKLMGTAQYGLSRPDVANVYKSYPNADKSGYSLDISLLSITDGNKTLRVEQIGNDGKVLNSQVSISIKRLPSMIVIDSPSDNSKISGDILKLRGWALNYVGTEKINIYLDNILVGTAKTGISRLDVYNVYPKYNNKNSGYTAEIDISNISGGIKTLKVEQVGVNGEKNTTSRRVYIDKLKPDMALDVPSDNSVINSNQLKISGWALNTSGIKEIKVYLDDKFIGNAKYGNERKDVYNVFPEYNNKNSGYTANIDISSISNGIKTLKIEQLGKDGSSLSIVKKINVVKPTPMIALDKPSEKEEINGNELKVSGWVLNTSGVKEIKIYLDDKFIGNAKYGNERQDVYNAFPEFNNKNSGYTATVDISKVNDGNKVLKVQQIGNDNSVTEVSKVISINKSKLLIALDTPNINTKINTNSLKVSGWALSSNKIDKINIYIDNKLIGKAQYGLERIDVYNAFPKYNNKNSGYSAVLDISKITDGVKELKVEQVDVSGNTIEITTKITINKLKPLIALDVPGDNEVISGNVLNISGWALNINEISSINIYIDNVLVGSTKCTVTRNDVYNCFPQYGIKKSGYSTTINLDKISGGRKTLKVEQVDVLGNKINVSKVININKLKPIMNIESQQENMVIKGKNMEVIGWALNSSNIRAINIYLDDIFMGTATYGLLRNDVYNAYPKYNNKNSGYKATIDISKVSDGYKKLKVEQIAIDGSSMIEVRTVRIANNLPNKICIDTPGVNEYIGSTTNMKIRGWALNDSGISKVNIYLDNVFVGNAKTKLSRKDVGNAYPEYNYSSDSGYEAIIDTTKLSIGNHTIKVEAYGVDGKVISESRKFNYGVMKKKVIVVDPGHNYGGDYGATSTHFGVTYSETELNMKVGTYLKEYLKDKGYDVVMTREASDRDKCSKDESLRKRVEIANNSNADAFISIHQNSYGLESASGVETYYCNDGSSRVNMSKKLAESTVNKLASSTSFKNRGAKPANFVVIKNTKMPAILVECGFISNHNEAVSLSKDSTQRKIALSIAESIKEQIN